MEAVEAFPLQDPAPAFTIRAFLRRSMHELETLELEGGLMASQAFKRLSFELVIRASTIDRLPLLDDSPAASCVDPAILKASSWLERLTILEVMIDPEETELVRSDAADVLADFAPEMFGSSAKPFGSPRCSCGPSCMKITTN